MSASPLPTRANKETHVTTIQSQQYFILASLLPTTANRETCHYHPLTAAFRVSITVTTTANTET